MAGDRSVKTVADPVESFFHELTGAFEEAGHGRLTTERISVAGHTIDIRFAGDMLRERVMAALLHLAHDEDGPASFTIDVFDSGSTGVQVGPPPWGPYDYLARGEIRGFNTGSYRTAYRVDSGVLSMSDLSRGRGVFWIRDERFYPAWMQAAPLRTLLSWWASSKRLQFVHGAAVGLEGHGLLLSAPGGSGKSTTAVNAALGGMQFLGDDYVIADPSSNTVHSVYSSAKLTGAMVAEFFSHFASRSRGTVGGPSEEKEFFLGTDLFPDSMADLLLLEAIVVPAVTGGVTVVTELEPAAALTAVAPTTLFQLEGTSTEDFAVISRLVRSLPTFRLCIGADDGAVGALRQLVGQLSP